MGFFSDIGKKTTETADKIAKETKLKRKISDNKEKIVKQYGLMGKKAYEAYKNGAQPALEEDYTQIDTWFNENEEARLEILKLNQKKVCSNCATEIMNNVSFCPKCGQKQETATTTTESTVTTTTTTTTTTTPAETKTETTTTETSAPEKVDIDSDITNT